MDRRKGAEDGFYPDEGELMRGKDQWAGVSDLGLLLCLPFADTSLNTGHRANSLKMGTVLIF